MSKSLCKSRKNTRFPNPSSSSPVFGDLNVVQCLPENNIDNNNGNHDDSDDSFRANSPFGFALIVPVNYANKRSTPADSTTDTANNNNNINNNKDNAIIQINNNNTNNQPQPQHSNNRHTRNRQRSLDIYADGSELSDSFIALGPSTKTILTVRVNNNNNNNNHSDEDDPTMLHPTGSELPDEHVPSAVQHLDKLHHPHPHHQHHLHNHHQSHNQRANAKPEMATVVNANACLLCMAPFNLLLNKRLVCSQCALHVCRNCCSFLEESADWICTVCEQQRSLANHCSSWICKRLKNAIHFGDAKHRFGSDRDSDVDDTLELESGADAADAREAAIANGTGHDVDDEEQRHRKRQMQRELQAVSRSDIELIVIKMLGVDTIDHAHVGLLFDDAQYFDFVDSATHELAEQLRLLQTTLLVRTITETDCNDLSRLLAEASEASFQLPPLRLRNTTQSEIENLLEECEYEYLLANAILNQIVEVSQSRFMTATSVAGTSSHQFKSSNFSPSLASSMSGSFRVRSSCSAGSYYANSQDSYESGKMLAQSTSPTSLEELEDEEYIDDEEYEQQQQQQQTQENLNFDAVKVEFPEAGVDLVDSRKFPSCDSDLSHDSGIKIIDSSNSWQDNWLFKKSKDNRTYSQYHLNSDIHFGYMAMALSESVPMLIPNPSHVEKPTIGDEAVEYQSDMSEHNSENGSITFSDEESDNELQRSDAGAKNVEDGESIAARQIKFSSLLARAENLHKARMLARKDAKIASSTVESVNLAFARRFLPLNVPEFVPHESRTVSSLLPNPHERNLGYVPSILLKPGNARIHSGITAQFCCKTSGLFPVHFAWFKDGNLIACSDEKEAQKWDPNCKLRILTGTRHVHRRSIEWPNALLGHVRLVMINECESILELQKTSNLMSGVYSIVAYNHAGCDWADFKLAVDPTHFVALQLNINRSRSPRPAPRRAHKSRKCIIAEIDAVIEHQQRAIIEMLTRAVNVRKGISDEHQPFVAIPAVIYNELPPAEVNFVYETLEDSFNNSAISPRPGSRSSKIRPQSVSPIPNFRQRTWDERQGKPGAQTLMPELPHDVVDGSDEPPAEVDPEMMLISKREHSKWLHPDVELANNPYTAENAQKRPKLCDDTLQPSQDDGEVDEEEDEDTLEKAKFYSDRDMRRYKRDFYIPKVDDNNSEAPSFSVLNSLSGKKSKSIQNFMEEPSSLDTNSCAISTLGSLEPEPILTAITPEPTQDIANSNHSGNLTTKKPAIIGSEVKREIDVELRSASSMQIKDQALSKLPSVKNLVSLFSSSSEKESRPAGSPIPNSTSSTSSSSSNSTKPAKNYKVNASITARSMSREMRNETNKQMPKPMNRISLSNERVTIVEIENINPRSLSPEKSQS